MKHTLTVARDPLKQSWRAVCRHRNVCARLNPVNLRDGAPVAIVFNQPNHARTDGDIDCRDF